MPKDAVLNPRKWVDIKLIKKTKISPDTIRFQFELPKKGKLGLPVGQHVLLAADINEHLIVRPYTPVSPVGLAEENGTVEFVIKIYRKGVNKMFPMGGVMSQFLESLSEGDSIQMKGPAGHILYYGDGVFNVDGKSVEVNQVAMVAGGTGITPMYQLIKAILKNPKEKTKMMLLYSNHTEEDTLLKSQLDEMAEKYSERLKVWYTVSNPPKEDWKFSTGRLNEVKIDLVKFYNF
jgi:nitrate reductase (NAD(P)H)